VYRHRKPSALADRLQVSVDGIGRERRAALGGEDVAAVRILLAQRRQYAQLITADGMNAGLAILGPPNVKSSRPAELDLAPFELASLNCAQAMPVARQDQAGVPMPPAAFPGRLEQLLNLGWRQILPCPHVGIGQAPKLVVNLPVFVTWLDELQVQHSLPFPSVPMINLPDNEHSPVSRQAELDGNKERGPTGFGPMARPR
jgi:hypothetical protein